MEGDADGYQEGVVYSNTYEGVIEILHKFYLKLNKGKGKWANRDNHREAAEELFIKHPVLLKELELSPEDEKDEDAIRDYASDYLASLGHGNYGPSYDYPRVIDRVELTYFDDKGDEYIVDKV